jgi:hypothetical protein
MSKKYETDAHRLCQFDMLSRGNRTNYTRKILVVTVVVLLGWEVVYLYYFRNPLQSASPQSPQNVVLTPQVQGIAQRDQPTKLIFFAKYKPKSNFPFYSTKKPR